MGVRIRNVPVTCALCESRCGLTARVDGDRVLGLKPDPTHPVSRGHACVKGLHFHRVHHHEDRLTRPRLGGWYTDWPDALEALGGRLRALLDRHGPDSVGIYSGNAAGHSLGAVLGVSALQRAVGTTRHYSCLTLDNAPQFVVYEEVFGAAMRTFAADFAHADAICLFGTDPLSSQCSQAQSNPRGTHHLRSASQAGSLWVVDPRASRTARAGRHLAVRPGSDVAVLGWLLGQALAADRMVDGVREGDRQILSDAVRDFDRARASRVSGVDEAELQALCDALIAAERPLVWSGLGLLLGGQGTVAFWLTVALQCALGGVDAVGGWRIPGVFDMGALARRIGLRGRDRSVRGRSGHPAILDTIPAADLVSDIEAGALKALVVVGGNPALALPDQGRAHQALQELDLLVCLDLFENDTGTLADAVLPVRSWLARDDLPLHLAGQRWSDDGPVEPELEPAAVGPIGAARGDFEILVGLARAAGCRPFGSRVADLALRRLDPVLAARWVVRWVPRRTPPVSLHRDGAIHLAIPEFLDALEVHEPADVALVTSVRPVETLNHWMHGSRAARRRQAQASAHPATLEAAGVGEGPVDLITGIACGERRVTVQIIADQTLREGVVVLPFGWGHLPGAVESGGVSANRLIGSDDLEAFTGQPRSNGIAVRIEPATDVP